MSHQDSRPLADPPAPAPTSALPLHEDEATLGPGWATQVDMEQDNGQDSGLAASDHSLSSLKSRKTERFNIGEIVHFISDSWSSVSGDSSIPVFSAAKEAKVPVA